MATIIGRQGLVGGEVLADAENADRHMRVCSNQVSPSSFTSNSNEYSPIPNDLSHDSKNDHPSFIPENNQSNTSIPKNGSVLYEAEKFVVDENCPSVSTSQECQTVYLDGDLPPTRVRDFSFLNRSDLDELHLNERHLNYHQETWLDLVEKKKRLYPLRYDHDDYLENCALLILSGSPSAQRLAFCGVRSPVNPTTMCRLHHYCPYCCYKVRTERQVQYVPAFDSANWHFLTGSFKGNYLYNTQTAHHCLIYWDAWKTALTGLIDEGLIEGVYWVEELAITSMLPTIALPHIHAICNGLTDEAVETLKANVQAYINDRLDEPMQVDIKHEAITDDKGLLDRIGYMHKTLKLLRAYRNAWTAASWNNRAGVPKLNSDLTDIVQGFAVNNYRRPKMQAKGTLNPRAKQFIGIKAPGEVEKRQIRELGKQRTEFIEVNDYEEI